MYPCPLWGGQHPPQECSRGMAIKAWCWGAKAIGNWAVVSFIADCSACLSRDVWLPPALVPLKLAHIPNCPDLLSHPSLCYFTSPPFCEISGIRTGCSPLLDVLGSAGGWWGLCCGNSEPVPMACRSLLLASLAPSWLCSAWGLCIGSREVYSVRGDDVAALPPLLSAQIPNLGKGEVHLLPEWWKL